MTAGPSAAPVPPPTRAAPVPVPAGRAAADAAVLRLAARLVRRGAVLLALALAAYTAVEVFSYLATYPDAASRARLATLQDNPAVRMLQGIPHGVDTPGGFVAWDGGWLLEWIVGIWALLAAARLLRGEEESQRAELVLAGPVRAPRAAGLQLLVVIAGTVLAGALVAVVLVAAGTGVAGSLLFGLGLAAFGATCACLAAVSAQVFEVRQRAVGAAAGVLGLLFLVRMVANSSDGRGWLRRLTPFGWMDELHAYQGPDWVALAALLAAPVALGVLAMALRRSRDSDSALITRADRRPARLRLLGSPLAFTWRGTRGMLAGWTAGIAGYALVMGLTVKSVTDFIAQDPHYREMLARLGWDAARATDGYLGIMGTVLGLLLCLYVCWRVGAARTEEASGRLDNTLTRPVSRHRWLGGHLLLTAATALLIAAVSGLAMWAGAAATGAGVTAPDALASVANPLPVVALFAGAAVLVYSVRPRLTVAVPVSAAVAAYLVQVIGTALRWPGWVLDVSPFHHLATVPLDPFAATAGTVMACLGLAAAAAGTAAFGRRDLTGE